MLDIFQQVRLLSCSIFDYHSYWWISFGLPSLIWFSETGGAHSSTTVVYRWYFTKAYNLSISILVLISIISQFHTSLIILHICFIVSTQVVCFTKCGLSNFTFGRIQGMCIILIYIFHQTFILWSNTRIHFIWITTQIPVCTTLIDYLILVSWVELGIRIYIDRGIYVLLRELRLRIKKSIHVPTLSPHWADILKTWFIVIIIFIQRSRSDGSLVILQTWLIDFCLGKLILTASNSSSASFFSCLGHSNWYALLLYIH